MNSVQDLIDAAAQTCGSQSALARRLNVTPQRVSEWRYGKVGITPETAVLLCAMLGFEGGETRRMVAIAMIANPKNRSRAKALRDALFTGWVAGVALLSASSSDAASIGSNARTTSRAVDWLYIVARGALRRARRAVTAFLRASWFPATPRTL